MRIFSLLFAFALASFADEVQTVVLAVSSHGKIEAFEPNLLLPIGSYPVGRTAESVSFDPYARRLYVARDQRDTHLCCSLFSLDLDTHQLCSFDSHALFGLPSTVGNSLFAQRENGGLDVFDTRTLEKISSIDTPGTYNLQQSHDGKWLLGVTNTPKPSVDIFDLERRALVRSIPLPAGPATGAWTGDDFSVFVHDGLNARIWRLRPESTKLPEPVQVNLPDLHHGCKQPVLLTVAGSLASDHLLVAEAFGFQNDRRHSCGDQARGGIYAVDPKTGRVDRHFAESIHINRMMFAPDHIHLFAIESFGPDEHSGSRLLKLNSGNGTILASRDLDSGSWNLAVGGILASFYPHGAEYVTPCHRSGSIR